MTPKSGMLLSEEAKRQIIAGLKGGIAAADELMTEFISKRRAAKWDVLNDGLVAARKALRLVETDGE